MCAMDFSSSKYPAVTETIFPGCHVDCVGQGLRIAGVRGGGECFCFPEVVIIIEVLANTLAKEV